MSKNRSQTGLCIVRVEFLDAGLLITLTTSPNIEEISAQVSRRVGDIEGAVEEVRHFLVEFAQPGDGVTLR